jgi:hypothetical protein
MDISGDRKAQRNSLCSFSIMAATTFTSFFMIASQKFNPIFMIPFYFNEKITIFKRLFRGNWASNSPFQFTYIEDLMTERNFINRKADSNGRKKRLYSDFFFILRMDKF